MTKWFNLRGPLGDRAEPEHTMIVQRGTLPLACHVEVLRKLLHGSGAPLYFVGDLDPYDLTVYLALTHGGVDAAPDSPRLDVSYLGVGDWWLALCREHQLPDLVVPPERKVWAERLLRPFELENLRWLEAVTPDLAALVGPESAAVLRAGRGLDIEGASAKGLYHPDFYSTLWDRLMAPNA